MFRRFVVAQGLIWAVTAGLAAPVAAQEAAVEEKSSPPVAAQKAAAEEMSSPASLARIAICQEVQERAPVGESEQFSNAIGNLWCFTKVVNADVPTKIFHRWYVGDKLVDEIPITVGGKSWRCWSNKTIYPGWSGPCRVEILTESGDVLGTKEFTLSESSSEPSDS